MTRQIADHRSPPSGSLARFLRIARPRRDSWHRSEAPAGTRRVVEFCRIERGRTA